MSASTHHHHRMVSIGEDSGADRPQQALCSRANYNNEMDLISDNRTAQVFKARHLSWRGTVKWLLPLVVLFSQIGAGRAAQKELFYRVTEELKTGSFVGDVKEDAGLTLTYDSDTLKQFHYQFLTEPATNFAIGNKTGIISTNGRIDRDILCPMEVECKVQLDVAIRPVQFFQIIKITVEILDLNDNAPTFEDKVITHHMFESASIGTGFTVRTATDPDSPEFSVLAYELISDADNFELKVTEKFGGDKEVRLVLVEKLDREAQALYEMQIAAFDGGIPSKSGYVDVRITVGDANDNSPVFEKPVYEVSAQENTLEHTVLLTVTATDPDDGTNGQVVYQFSEQTERQYGRLFAIGRENGEISVEGVIDYEEESIYNLGVTARDLGPDSTPGDATVIVRVEDMNDHAPQIKVSTLTATGTSEAKLPEDSPPDTFVAHLTVKDPDTGSNGKFNCSLNDSYFRLERIYDTEYSIFTAGALDREKQSSYNLALVCKDHGEKPLTAVQHIKVSITDVNDNTPVFLQKRYSAELMENNYIGAYLVQVNASDLDSGENARLEFVIEGDDANYFAVDQRTGVVKARDSLDREERDEYLVPIVARDQGRPSRSASALLSVRVLDVNDERPQFSAPTYSFGVTEEMPAGQEVGTVWADDADGVPYNAFTFSLVASESQTEAFYIEPTEGRITTTRPLDRENQRIYRLLVVATDVTTPTMSSTASVTVHVMDVNDNTPVFTFPTKVNHTAYLSNKAPTGYIVTKVNAYDLDIGNNSNLLYEISRGNSEKYFQMDPKTGAVYLERDISEIKNRTFTILVAVIDHGAPQRINATELMINIDAALPFALAGSNGALLSGYNFIIVIAIACVGGVIIVILLLAIAVVIRQQKLRHNRTHKYNCRMEALKTLTAKETMAAKAAQNGGVTAASTKNGDVRGDASDCSGKSAPSLPGSNGKIEYRARVGSQNSNTGGGGGDMTHSASKGSVNKVDLSHEKSRQWLATLEPPEYQQVPPDPNDVDPETGDMVSPLPRDGKDWGTDHQPGMEHLSHLRDGDMSSIHSGDGSNTDSGRGASETGESGGPGTRLEAHQAAFMYGKTTPSAQNNNSVLLKTRPVYGHGQHHPHGRKNSGPVLQSFKSDGVNDKYSAPNPNGSAASVPKDAKPSQGPQQPQNSGGLSYYSNKLSRGHSGYTPLGQSSPGDYNGGTRYGHALSSSGYSTNSNSDNTDVTPTNDPHNDSVGTDDDATTIAGSYVVDDGDATQDRHYVKGQIV